MDLQSNSLAPDAHRASPEEAVYCGLTRWYHPPHPLPYSTSSALLLLCLPLSALGMDDKQTAQHAIDEMEKSHHQGGIRVATQAAKPRETLYDPSQETLATRWGLSLESFKRAPGSTG